MSSIIVYGDVIDSNGKITLDTTEHPKNAYGDSKLKAEKLIKKLDDETFKVVILRPPMIYGPKSKGNFPLLFKFANYSPIFPSIENKRSMLYIENLCLYVKKIIDNGSEGIYYPRNKENMSTSNVIKTIRKHFNKNVYLTSIFNPFIKLFMKTSLMSKVFGNLYYDEEIPNGFLDIDQELISFNDSINKIINQQ